MTKVGIIGAGRMGSCMALALGRAGYDVTVSNRTSVKLRELEAECPQLKTTLRNDVAAKDADLVIVAVRPDITEAVVGEIYSVLAPGAVLATLSPSFTLARIADTILNFNGVHCARIMPNTAVRLGESMTFVCMDPDTPDSARAMLVDAMDQLGTVAVVPESLFGAATALCSCGIAYALRYVRASVEGAVQMGFAPEDATRYVAATLRGAAALLGQEGAHPESEIDRVTTPGGTTIRGLNAMEAAGFTSAVIAGLIASSHE